jgi:hypothetical protein
MSTFDPLKATREEIAGVSGILESLKRQEQVAEEAMSKAETDLNALRKLRGFAQIYLQQKRDELARLEAAKQ